MAQSGALGPPCDRRTALQRLKAQTIPSGNELMAFYAERNGEIEDILRDHNLIVLPRTPLPIDAMSEAESLSLPAPNMDPGPVLDPIRSRRACAFQPRSPAKPWTISAVTRRRGR